MTISVKNKESMYGKENYQMPGYRPETTDKIALFNERKSHPMKYGDEYWYGLSAKEYPHFYEDEVPANYIGQCILFSHETDEATEISYTGMPVITVFTKPSPRKMGK